MSIFKRKDKERPDFRKTAQHFEQHRNPTRNSLLKCPEWLEPEYDENGNYVEEPDQLYLLYDPFLQRRFYKEGKIAAGALVQANVQLFQKGSEDCPANFIYSTDIYYMDKPDELLWFADALFSAKGEAGFHPSIQRLADILADEYERAFCYKLPRDLTEGRDVYFTTVMVQRSHLQKQRITGRLYPMLVLELNQPDAMILPHWYWQS